MPKKPNQDDFKLWNRQLKEIHRDIGFILREIEESEKSFHDDLSDEHLDEFMHDVLDGCNESRSAIYKASSNLEVIIENTEPVDHEKQKKEHGVVEIKDLDDAYGYMKFKGKEDLSETHSKGW